MNTQSCLKKRFVLFLYFVVVISFFLIPNISHAVRKCGLSPGERIELPQSWTGYNKGGCCKVESIDYDADLKDYVVIIKCSDCWNKNPALQFITTTFNVTDCSKLP